MAPDVHVNVIVVLVTVLTVGMAVGLHYEGLNWLARRLSTQPHARRRRVLYAVVGALLLHITEIWMFGAAYWACLALPGAGGVTGAADGGLLENVYLSAMTFSTVGFGDVAPHGAIRFIAGTEAVLGLFLIAWSATFTYYEMSQNWKDR
ncbi:ion transporter [Lysobacter helvus]|uniref:Ion transporter n=2 Tax=Lysobacteraceae TaxID=32033 RepID=A0ABM7Q6L6_9GAMM|nr:MULTISPECIES: potassium channel family protein [Lysobacter]BCT93018.1 ion transporter [Lysobacter caseinilyticus]BCT96170.1 ion transporter [Lysobacter helvus]